MREKLTELPYGLAGKFYRSPMPFSPAFDPGSEVLEAYKRASVDTVVMLTPDEEVQRVTGRSLRNIYQQMGYAVIYVPVEDFSIPEPGQFEKAIPQALAAGRVGKTVAVHCHAGLGRSGIFAACLAKVVFGFSGDAAFAWVRKFIPEAVETQTQYQYVIDFNYSED